MPDDGAVPNIALPLPHPRPRGRRHTSPDEVMPETVAAPEILEAVGLRWIHIESPRWADRDWLEWHSTPTHRTARSSTRATSDPSLTSTTITPSSCCTFRPSARTATASWRRNSTCSWAPTTRSRRPMSRSRRSTPCWSLAVQDRRHVGGRVVPDAAQDGAQAGSRVAGAAWAGSGSQRTRHVHPGHLASVHGRRPVERTSRSPPQQGRSHAWCARTSPRRKPNMPDRRLRLT